MLCQYRRVGIITIIAAMLNLNIGCAHRQTVRPWVEGDRIIGEIDRRYATTMGRPGSQGRKREDFRRPITQKIELKCGIAIQSVVLPTGEQVDFDKGSGQLTCGTAVIGNDKKGREMFVPLEDIVSAHIEDPFGQVSSSSEQLLKEEGQKVLSLNRKSGRLRVYGYETKVTFDADGGKLARREPTISGYIDGNSFSISVQKAEYLIIVDKSAEGALGGVVLLSGLIGIISLIKSTTDPWTF